MVLLKFLGGPNAANPTKVQPLLDWKYIQHSLPWGVVLLMGGGFALSDGALYSGLSYWLGQQLRYLEALPKEIILVIVMLLAACCTEVASNSATVNVFLPMLIALVSEYPACRNSRELKITPSLSNQQKTESAGLIKLN